MTLNVSRLQHQVREAEGFRATPYRDTEGRWTVGYGRCLETHPLTLDEILELLRASPLPRDVAERWMQDEIAACWGELLAAGPRYRSILERLSDVRLRVLLEMAYQMGVGGVLGFRRMWDALEIGDYEKAASEMLDSRWRRQTPARAERLAWWMRTGEDQ